MTEYEVRFALTRETEKRLEEVKNELEKIKDYEFTDYYFKKDSGETARVREWYLPSRKVEVVKANYTFKVGKKGDKIKLPVENLQEGFDMLCEEGFEHFLIVKKENGSHYSWKKDKRIRIAIEDVYCGSHMENLEYVGRLGEIEVIAQTDEEAISLIHQATKYFRVKNHTSAPLLEILLQRVRA
jgi:adenylate cyclase class IV